MDRFKGVIFDLDGTLIDSKADLADATNRVLREEGFPQWPVEQYGLFLGRGIRNLVLNALPVDRRDEVTVDRIRDKVLADYGRNYLVKTRMYPGIALLLDNLRVRGMKLAVLSNKPDAITQKIMAELFAPWKFDAVLGAGTELPMKPDPEAVFYLCTQIGIKLEEALYVGDSDVDMQTAANAGLRSIGVSWGFRDREELQRAGAWKMADRAEEILDVLR